MNETKSGNSRAFLVGDNPFHNISHLSQERTRERGYKHTAPDQAAHLISIAAENGANGFLFSVSDTTLAILRALKKMGASEGLDLYPIVPYAYEYVRLATQVGGIPGLAKIFSKRLVTSGSLGAIVRSLDGIFRAQPPSLLKAYLTYEMNRVNAAKGKNSHIRSILLHEIIVDMALSLDLGWFFKEYSDFALKRNLLLGFNTCNFAFLIDKLEEWDIDTSETLVAAPFNKIGFQMNPSKAVCEEALKAVQKPILIAISVLAAGYLKPTEAVDYLASLPNLRGAAIGVSKESHAREAFKLLNQRMAR